ncbi:MAG TPA: (d)CMP kinase [Candidatus Megaira endosymbiont of Nemacystus decipiens]|nr:(d)CMP kinase [Candidatus Megaera endosymbiont of Nemacystus decipiens]
MERVVISLDGPSGSGKGLIGSMMAKEFSLKYFQSSLIYRGLAYICMSRNIAPEETEKIIKIARSLDIVQATENIDLNTEEIGNFTSKISSILEVRNIISFCLKDIVRNNHRILMEGRDIGSVIAPDADLKLFITADIITRAKRRYKQLCLEGKSCILSDVLNLMRERDKRDSLRKSSPLEIPHDAILVDTSNLSPEKVIEKIKSSMVNHKNADDLLRLFNLNAEKWHYFSEN